MRLFEIPHSRYTDEDCKYSHKRHSIRNGYRGGCCNRDAESRSASDWTVGVPGDTDCTRVVCLSRLSEKTVAHAANPKCARSKRAAGGSAEKSRQVKCGVRKCSGADHSRSRQFGPTPASTTSGTRNSQTFSIRSLTRLATSSISSCGTSKTSSS